jgi:hypothetical protein
MYNPGSKNVHLQFAVVAKASKFWHIYTERVIKLQILDIHGIIHQEYIP